MNLEELLHPRREEQAGSVCLLLDEDVFHPPRASGHSTRNWAEPPRFSRASVLLKMRSELKAVLTGGKPCLVQ